MATPKHNHIVVSSDTEIDLPPSRRIMVIYRAEWDRLKKMIGRISEASDYWQNAAWFFLAAAISFFIAAITTTGPSVQPPNLLTMLSLISLVAAVILFVADYAIGRNRKIAKQDIIDFMVEMSDNTAAAQRPEE